ncbi:MAG: hypothetical protein AAGD08_14900 [Pseudomonadota bacterium]
MADTRYSATATRPGWFGRAYAQAMRAQDASLEIRRLLDLSDAALAARGLNRAGVVAHVWRRYPSG